MASRSTTWRVVLLAPVVRVRIAWRYAAEKLTESSDTGYLHDMTPQQLMTAVTFCRGVSPLRAKWENWMAQCLEKPQELAALVAEHGSPVHLHYPDRLKANARNLLEVARAHEIDFRIFFARKANKCLSYVDEAHRMGLGVDTASFNELAQCVRRYVSGDRLVYTAAIKEAVAVDLAIEHGATIVIDNLDELGLVKSRLRSAPISNSAVLAIRLRGFELAAGIHRSRFGIDYIEAESIIRSSLDDNELGSRIDWRGLHFHLDGNDVSERIAAMHQSLDLIESLRSIGATMDFIDIGGGFPVCYLKSEAEWRTFWQQIDRQVFDADADRVTAPGQDLGSVARDGRVVHSSHIYPYWQPLTAPDWFDQILRGANDHDETVTRRCRDQRVQMRSEPGRALLDGCGMTIARVAFRKLDSDGSLLVGLAMNRTNCRTTGVDFPVDPELMLVGRGDRSEAAEGYFVGAYCMESEYITPRKFCFSEGVAVDDLVVFPNTAGYLMHFMESRSHQFDLPRNLVLCGDPPRFDTVQIDEIDH